MTPLEIKKLASYAKGMASRGGFPDLADDFSQHFLEKKLMGSKQPNKYIWIDFLRLERGSSRSKCGRLQQATVYLEDLV